MIDPEEISNAFSKVGKLKEVFTVLDKNDYGTSVMYILKLMKQLEILPYVQSETKCKDKSDFLREEGNKHFKLNEYDLALQHYNLALLYAPKNSKSMQLAYGNRSALFFQIKRYKACIHDIDTALSMGFPDDLVPKLLKRKNSCQIMQEKEPKVKNFIEVACAKFSKMTGTVNKNIPCASASVKLEMDNDKRVVVADRTIKVGDVIAIEVPYVSHPSKENQLFCCYSCLKYTENLSPCLFCCTVMYCGDECRNRSWQDGHRVECQMMSVCGVFCNLFRLSLKAVLKSRIECSSWDELMERVHKANALKGVNRGFVEDKSKKLELDSKYYESICTQGTLKSVRKLQLGFLFNLSVQAAVAVHAMSSVDFMMGFKGTKDELIKFVSQQLVFHAVDGINKHMSATVFPPFEDDPCDAKYEMPNKAIGFFAFAGLMDHSCNPNVECFGLNNKLVMIATKTMSAGCELVTSYGLTFLGHKLSQRRYILYKNFNLVCKCEACENDWVIEDRLDFKISRRQNDILIYSCFNKIYIIRSLGEAVENFEDLCQGLEVFQDKPTSQYFWAFYSTFKECIKRFQYHLAPQHMRGYILDIEMVMKSGPFVKKE